ncbi:uncharacterized protein LOC133730305 [Rosa rugosa]|uniref:uncharacterized protein LOC133730305 n=1 Tax=Rosa rugosa TaxID=74645 RepID=UPI002B418364|nr:uncharacterized protein LOC133730305 [Rosa rugosa]
MDQSLKLASVSCNQERSKFEELPDCILESIVSFLPLRDAMESSMIFRGLKHIWLNSIQTRRNLVFDVPNIYGSWRQPRKDDEDFIRRVDQFLERYPLPRMGVQELRLPMPTNFGPLYNDDFPHQLLSEQQVKAVAPLKLKSLSLKGFRLRVPPEFDGFNQLTTLCLHSVKVDGIFMSHLFSLGSFLERLTLKNCTWEYFYSHLNIVSGRLNDFKLISCTELEKIEISAPNLASLEYIAKSVYPPSSIVFVNTPKLAKLLYLTDLSTTDPTLLPQTLRQLIPSCPALETLDLQMCAERPQIGSLPTFGNLKQLNLQIKRGYYNSIPIHLRCVVDLLKVAPLLEELTITIEGQREFDETDHQEIRNLDCGFTHNQLKKVKMHGIQGNWYEIEFAIWILKNTTNLEIMVIDPNWKRYLGDGDYIELNHSTWQKGRHRAVVREKLKEVKTDARIRILNRWSLPEK